MALDSAPGPVVVPADGISPPWGLTSQEAALALAKFGPNAMPDTSRHLWRDAAKKLWAPVPWMLEAAITLELILGKFLEGDIIAALLIFSAALGLFQEGRAQTTLAALRSRLALNASVRRDGAWKNIPSESLVPGDIIKLFLGGIVAADVTLRSGDVLLDQSMLTGESVPIEAGAGLHTFAGALIRRGEAIAEVTATGIRTKFGRTAELVRTAHVVSSQQKAVLLVVRYLAAFNGAVIIAMGGYAWFVSIPVAAIVPLILTAVLASIPVALPATFTLSAALGARNLARLNILSTRLSAVDEAAAMDVLCADKTGTLTRNALQVAAIQAAPGFDNAYVLARAISASADGGQDPVDAAIRACPMARSLSRLQPKLLSFIPFDPATKMASAVIQTGDGAITSVVKGALNVVSALAAAPAPLSAAAKTFEDQGYRLLAVAAGPSGAREMIGLIALSDPPRTDAAELVKKLKDLGVRMVMVTGDSIGTATTVAHAVGLSGDFCPQTTIPDDVRPETFAGFAGVLPEQKFQLVQSFQKSGHVVGMCGDGANDAPALRQAHIGIAVSTATDVAKSAAGMVLTEPGLEGIIAAVHEGRRGFQRILTYTVNIITKKIATVLFLAIGLLLTGHAVLTPMLMVILMVTGDFLAMSLTTDHVVPSPRPNVWRIGHLTIAGIILGICLLAFCLSVIAVGDFHFHLATGALQTLAFITMVYAGQATLYAIRGHRQFFGPRPSAWLAASSATDILIASALALTGIAMTALPVAAVFATLTASLAFAVLLDLVTLVLFERLEIS
jgi:H+-transporting ATPase